MYIFTTMNDIYLIRHTTPAVARGICYGQTDLDLTETFQQEADVIRGHLPSGFSRVYSSPLQRCARLAQELFPGHSLLLRDSLMEVNCGDWEMKAWDDLPKDEVNPWMEDFVNIRTPGGESYLDLHSRVSSCWQEVVDTAATSDGPVAVVAHGGVIRSLLSGVTNTPLIDSFKAFSLYYGCVIRITKGQEGLSHEILSNIMPPEWQQHKPSSYYKK